MEWIFSPQSIQQSPSRRDGIPEEIEIQYRRKTTFFLEELGKELKCDRFAVSTALVFYHRFFALQSYKSHSRFIMSATCLFLASKAEESPRKLYDIVYYFCRLRLKRSRAITETERLEMPNTILLAERVLLQTLCFDLQIVHPYKACLDKARLIKPYLLDHSRKEFHQLSVNFINDSFRTTLCIEHPPAVIALGALFLAALQMGIRPVNPNPKSTVEHTWFALLEAEIEFDVLQTVCLDIVDLIEDDSRTNPGTLNDGKGAQLRNRLETYNAINSNIIHHPSPTTVALLPPQELNTKDHINISNGQAPSHAKINVKNDRSGDTPVIPDYPFEDQRRKQIKISHPLSSLSSSYSVQHPPPLPSPIYQSPSSLASATPPPPPPDTPSFHCAQPDTPNWAPPPPDTPDSVQSTPAPPPPPTPSVYDRSDESGYDSQAGTPAPPPPPTPDYSGPTPTQTQSATKFNAAATSHRRPFHQLETDSDFAPVCRNLSPKKRKIE